MYELDIDYDEKWLSGDLISGAHGLYKYISFRLNNRKLHLK